MWSLTLNLRWSTAVDSPSEFESDQTNPGATASRLERAPTAQAWEAREISILGDPFAPGFDRERREIGVSREVSSCVPLFAEIAKYGPMPLSGRDSNGIGMFADLIGIGQRDIHWGRRIENVLMRQYSDTTAQYKFGVSVASHVAPKGLEPSAILAVICRILAMSIDENVDVRKDH